MGYRKQFLRHLFLRLLLLSASALTAGIFCFYVWQAGKPDVVELGKISNREAWEATYTERGLSIPIQGPREGYWGSRLGAKVPDERLGWHEPQVEVEGLLSIDGDGLQHAGDANDNAYRIVVFGGSVAFGAYASTERDSYFHVLADSLREFGVAAHVTVYASGAWKSIQEVAALQEYLLSKKADLVIFLDGLNDLTNGSTSYALFGQKVPTHDGSEWNVLYHAQDYVQRINDYLKYVDVASKTARRSGASFLVVLQPALFERERPTAIERSLLKDSLVPLGKKELLQQSYKEMRESLLRRAESAGFYFLDASRLFYEEKHTTFTDMWHFSDYGHAKLGRAMAERVEDVYFRR